MSSLTLPVDCFWLDRGTDREIYHSYTFVPGDLLLIARSTGANDVFSCLSLYLPVCLYVDLLRYSYISHRSVVKFRVCALEYA